MPLFPANPSFSLTLVLVFSAWLLIVTLVLVSTIAKYNRLVNDANRAGAKDIFWAQITRLSVIEERLGEMSETVKEMDAESRKHLQKVSLVRFNPFFDAGGDQSFAISLLDDKGNGVVFSSLHGREGTRVYAKSVKDFQSSGHEFSKEELEAVNYAARS